MARIDDFRAMLAQGGARPSQFQVLLNFPSWVNAGESTTKGIFLVKAASLPASTISPIEVAYRGRITKVAGERQFGNWNVTVINDNDFTIRDAMERWSQGILEHGATTGRLAQSDYQTDMWVHQLDRNNNIVKEYRFHNCHPQIVSEIGLDFGNTNQIEEFNVEFSVDYWTATNPLTGKAIV
jgi:hypothetical protein